MLKVLGLDPDILSLFFFRFDIGYNVQRLKFYYATWLYPQGGLYSKFCHCIAFLVHWVEGTDMERTWKAKGLRKEIAPTMRFLINQ